jgi:ATP-binding cassette, subfamily B (MDR/TAP), member 7
MSVGDIILVNTLLFQMSIPLNFLGSVYRDIRQGMQDMQTMFALTEQKSRIIEKPDAKALLVTPNHSHISFKNVTFGFVDYTSMENFQMNQTLQLRARPTAHPQWHLL